MGGEKPPTTWRIIPGLGSVGKWPWLSYGRLLSSFWELRHLLSPECINHDTDPVIKQPGFQWKVRFDRGWKGRFFSWAKVSEYPKSRAQALGDGEWSMPQPNLAEKNRENMNVVLWRVFRGYSLEKNLTWQFFEKTSMDEDVSPY